MASAIPPSGGLDLINGHIQAGRFEQAKAALVRALAKHPNDAAYLVAASVTFSELRELERALYYAKAATGRMPDSSGVWRNHGTILHKLGRYSEAMQSYLRAVQLDPSNAKANILAAQSALDECLPAQASKIVAAYQERAGENAEWLAAAARIYQHSGQLAKAFVMLKDAAAKDPHSITISEQLCSMANYVEADDPSAIFKLHQEFAKRLETRYPPAAAWASRRFDASRPTRVGFLSPDLRNHAVARFLLPLLREGSAHGLDFYLYHTGAHTDDVSKQLASHAREFRHVFGQSFASVAAMVRKDQIDLLIDLAGHTAGNALAVLTMRPAPVQATWIGYPGTTGLSCVDFRFTDTLLDPAQSDDFCTERLIRLDPTCHCFDPGPLPELSKSPRERTGILTFANFGSLIKQGESTRLDWAAALQATPNSRLLIKHSLTKEPELAASIRAQFAALGIDPSRIDVKPPIDNALDGYAEADIILDTAPYNGTTTTCEALWMGVPVVTKRTNTTPGRAGASLLAAVGLSDLVATSREQFAGIAARLAADHGRLAHLRASLRERCRGSALGDALAFARRFAEAVRRAIGGVA
ncbi:MAG: tetratricopeptide repeat protein [Planctomycetes bacterium]|nr:tetratricopeptide repeat protein [Planctomycetota bacterium]